MLRRCPVRKSSLFQGQLTKSRHPFVSFVSETFKFKEHALLALTQIYVGIKFSDTVCMWLNAQFFSIPGAGTAVMVLQTTQHTDVAPAGYMRRFRQPVQTSCLCTPEICSSKTHIQCLYFQSFSN
jgi:hypothetical protein